MRRCMFQQCHTVPSFNVEGTKKPIYCKKHAEGGMVNIRSKRCSYDACTKQSTYNVRGAVSPMYCKQHAEEGMVNVRGKLCSHDSCTKHPRYNVDGVKTPMYCKQHSEDGMVDVCSNRCAYDACRKQPNFNVEGKSKTLYCKTHAEDGMVAVHKRNSPNSWRGGRQQRGLSSNHVVTPCIKPAISDERGVTGLKRSRWPLDRPEPLSGKFEGPLTKGEVVQNAGMIPCHDPRPGSLACAAPSHAIDTNVQTATGKTHEDTSMGVSPLVNEQPLVLMEPIKTELELTIKL